MDNFKDFIGKKVTNITLNDDVSSTKVIIEFAKERIEINVDIENREMFSNQGYPVLRMNRVKQ